MKKEKIMKINKLLLIPILLLSAIAKLSAGSCVSYGEGKEYEPMLKEDVSFFFAQTIVVRN